MNTNEVELTRVNSDVNGNPRYVVHYSNLLHEDDKKEAARLADLSRYSFGIEEQYNIALKKAKSIGGRKYRGKDFGGGIVFQSYNTDDLKARILKLSLTPLKD